MVKAIDKERVLGTIKHEKSIIDFFTGAGTGIVASCLFSPDSTVRTVAIIVGLQGEIFMEGEETDKMFRRANCKARVAYLNGSKAIEAPPVELIQFVDSKIHKEQSDLFTTSISEVCFYTDDIDSVYKTLIENHVECLSEPQHFDFRADGFGESRAFYFRDPDGIILEMMQPL